MSDEWCYDEAYALGAGFLDRVRGYYPVADDMPDLYHTGAMLAGITIQAAAENPTGEDAMVLDAL